MKTEISTNDRGETMDCPPGYVATREPEKFAHEAVVYANTTNKPWDRRHAVDGKLCAMAATHYAVPLPEFYEAGLRPLLPDETVEAGDRFGSLDSPIESYCDPDADMIRVRAEVFDLGVWLRPFAAPEQPEAKPDCDCGHPSAHHHRSNGDVHCQRCSCAGYVPDFSDECICHPDNAPDEPGCVGCAKARAHYPIEPPIDDASDNPSDDAPVEASDATGAPMSRLGDVVGLTRRRDLEVPIDNSYHYADWQFDQGDTQK